MQMKETMKRYNIIIGHKGVKHNIKFEEQKSVIIKRKVCWNGVGLSV